MGFAEVEAKVVLSLQILGDHSIEIPFQFIYMDFFIYNFFFNNFFGCMIFIEERRKEGGEKVKRK